MSDRWLVVSRLRSAGAAAAVAALLGVVPALAAPPTEPTTIAPPTTQLHAGDLTLSVAEPPGCFTDETGRRVCDFLFVFGNNGPDDYWNPIDVTATVPEGMPACVTHSMSADRPVSRGDCIGDQAFERGRLTFNVLPAIPIQGWTVLVVLDVTGVPSGTVVSVTLTVDAPDDPVPANNAVTASATVDVEEPPTSTTGPGDGGMPDTGGELWPLLGVAAIALAAGAAAWATRRPDGTSGR